MTYNKIKNKIKKLLKEEESKIITQYKNKYKVYGLYTITNRDGLWEVEKYNEIIHLFTSSASAISYCLADKVDNIELAHNILVVDNKILRRKNNIIFNKKMLKVINDNEIRELLLNKLSEDLHQYKMLQLEISKCIEMTKYIQLKDLFNELKRPKPKNHSFSN